MCLGRQEYLSVRAEPEVGNGCHDVGYLRLIFNF